MTWKPLWYANQGGFLFPDFYILGRNIWYTCPQFLQVIITISNSNPRGMGIASSICIFSYRAMIFSKPFVLHSGQCGSAGGVCFSLMLF